MRSLRRPHEKVTFDKPSIATENHFAIQKALAVAKQCLRISKTILRYKIAMNPSASDRARAGCAFCKTFFSLIYCEEIRMISVILQPGCEIAKYRISVLTLADKIHHWVALSGVDRPAADFFILPMLHFLQPAESHHTALQIPFGDVLAFPGKDSIKHKYQSAWSFHPFPKPNLIVAVSSRSKSRYHVVMELCGSY